MKILFTVHQFFPRHIHGTERYTLELCHALQRVGHEVVVLTRSHHVEDSVDQDVNEYVFEGIRVVAIDLVKYARHDFDSSFDREDLDPIFSDILCRERPDIVHCCHLMYLGGTFIDLAVKTGAVIVVTFTDFYGICWTNRFQKFHGGICKGPDSDELNCIQDVLRTVSNPFDVVHLDLAYRVLVRSRLGVRFLRWLDRHDKLNCKSVSMPLRGVQKRRGCLTRHYLKADCFITATIYLRNSYVQYGFPKSRTLLLHFGINQPSEAEKQALRKRYETLAAGEREFVIGYIGQIAEHKGILDILHGFTSADLRNAKLVLYGDFKQDPKFSDRVHSYIAGRPNIELRGTFPGNEIYLRLASLDVLVVASTWAENSPLVLLNGLASRTMLVVTNVEGMADLIQHGVNGHLVPPKDPVALASVMKVLSTQRTKLLEWHDSAFQSYSKSPMAYAAEVNEIYARLLRESVRRKNFDRSTYPRYTVPPLLVRCAKLDHCNPTFVTQPVGLCMASWGIETTQRDGVVTQTLTCADGHITFEQTEAWPLNIYVRWPRSGLTVMYFSTVAEPVYSEARKVVRKIAGGIWYRLAISVGSEPSISRVRWDLLYHGAGESVEMAWAPKESAQFENSVCVQ